MSIAAIKAAVSLPALAAEYGEIRKSGAQWLMLCPWHHEQRPSLRVYEDHVYCFTCQASGDAIDFVAQMEGISKGRALRKLSERTGIPLDNSTRRTPIQRAGDRQDLAFALWWHGRQVTKLSRALTAYCIYATEEECEDLGLVLRQLRGLDRQAIIGAARRLGTAQDWRDWEADKKDAEFWTGVCVEMIAESAAA